MSDIAGYRVRDSNYILRFALIVFAGVAATGAVLSWRSQLLFASEYQEMPVTQAQIKVRRENEQIKTNLQQKINARYKLDEN